LLKPPQLYSCRGGEDSRCIGLRFKLATRSEATGTGTDTGKLALALESQLATFAGDFAAVVDLDAQIKW
jgi:hypothetical protein